MKKIHIFILCLFASLSSCTKYSKVTNPKDAPNYCSIYLTPNNYAGRQEGVYNPKKTPDIIEAFTSEQLISVLKSAKNGQTIVVFPGVYQIGRLKIKARINLVSQKHWGAIFPVNSLLELDGNGSRVEGFRFEGGGPISKTLSRDHSILITANNIKIIDNQFIGVGINSTVPDHTGITIEIIRANRTEVFRNEFSKSYSTAIKTDDFSKHTVISHNDFIDSPRNKGNGEIAHLGNALNIAQGISPEVDETNTLFTHNYVRGWKLESELISIKSDKNIISHNYIVDSGSSAFVVRMGNKNWIHHNFMTGNKRFPIRISGEKNLFEENIFIGSGALLFLHNATPYAKSVRNFAFHYWAARNNDIINNTFIGYQDAYAKSDQIHTMRNAAGGNEFALNTILTTDSNLLKKTMSSNNYVKFSNNTVKYFNQELCQQNR